MRTPTRWQGTYTQDWPSPTRSLPLDLRLHVNLWGAIRGTVWLATGEGRQRADKVRGRRLLGKVTLVVVFPSDAAGAGAQDPGEPAEGTALHLPTNFEGRVGAAGRMAGDWRAMTTWMVGPRRQKLPVVLATGTWSVQRATDFPA